MSDIVAVLLAKKEMFSIAFWAIYNTGRFWNDQYSLVF